MKKIPAFMSYIAILITVPALAYSDTLYVDDDPGWRRLTLLHESPDRPSHRDRDSG
jgi:hypothetical protein